MENNTNTNNNTSNWKVNVIVGFFGLVSTLGLAYLTYNQSSKDKMTDFKIEQLRIENGEKMAMYNRNLAYIYGACAELRGKLNASRVFIIQPHPPDRHHYMSVVIETPKPGVSYVRDIFNNVPMSDMASFAKLLSTNTWLYYDNISQQVDNKKALSMMLIAGSQQIAIRILINSKNEWVGSLVAENIQIVDVDKEAGKELIENCAIRIQYILPPIN